MFNNGSSNQYNHQYLENISNYIKQNPELNKEINNSPVLSAVPPHVIHEAMYVAYQHTLMAQATVMDTKEVDIVSEEEEFEADVIVEAHKRFDIVDIETFDNATTAIEKERNALDELFGVGDDTNEDKDEDTVEFKKETTQLNFY